MRVLGAILAGGQARRFGSDKARAEFDGMTLIDRVAAILAPQVDELILCGRAPGLVDRPPGVGPLGGIAAALHYGADRGFGAVVSVPCDTPILPGDLVAMIAGVADARFVRGLPVIGWWPTALADRIDDYLAGTTDYSIRAWTREIVAEPVTLDADIPNINTPGDLATLVTSRPA